ncbi:protein phosphatase 2C family protein [Vaginisenegalia massiliensis]|uniref:protein phosphatase 2C family protein n=1 Tax=Vaginisenegalia massiliensis TaxID=2058294 RepID=UPI000F53A328|nr:protein phosphatase 2C family protein [Vaginisenegalia massiliensis]
MIKIIESAREGKINLDLCEDSLYVSEHFVAVFDGVTAKVPFQLNGKSTGKIASELALEAMGQVDPKADIEEIINQINQYYQDFYATNNFPYDQHQFGIQAAAAIYSAYHHTIWLIGDCQALVEGRFYKISKLSDDILAGFRQLVVETNRATTQLDDQANLSQARDLIQPWLVQTRIFANCPDSPLGYSVLNGEPIPQKLIKTIPLAKEDRHIVMASDGYPQIFMNLVQTEAYLADCLAEDPDCLYRHPSTKGLKAGYASFDDRTYVRFQVSEE